MSTHLLLRFSGFLFFTCFANNILSQVRCCMPLILTLGSHRLVDLCMWSQPSLPSEFQDNRATKLRPCLSKTKHSDQQAKPEEALALKTKDQGVRDAISANVVLHRENRMKMKTLEVGGGAIIGPHSLMIWKNTSPPVSGESGCLEETALLQLPDAWLPHFSAKK